ncbi:MAG: tryptophan synthase subunit alpha [Endomicrobia bacterium]|nr:tryptophan synthase subunit alpha [Endomicrobiia bacterium]
MELKKVFEIKKQFIPFISCGFPTKLKTVEIIKLFLDEQIEVVEIGIPFSEPVADGPTIQYSSFVALKNNINMEDVFYVIEETLKYRSYFPVIMTYLNPVIIYGIEKFFKNAKDVGVKGVIFADAIVEEKEVFYSLTKKYGISNIFLLSPTTNKERRKVIYKYSDGFVYLVTLAGTTGVKKILPVNFYSFVKEVRKETSMPICAGFGISCPEQVLPILEYIDGVIVGSAIIEKIKEDEHLKSLKSFVRKFVSKILTFQR